MNWKTLVEKKNEQIYVLPEGWDSRDKVAEALDCAPERVHQLLAPLVKAGDVETQQFTIWDSGLKRLVRVVAYRKRGKDAEKSESRLGGWTDEELAEAKRMASAGKTYRQIGDKLGRSKASVRLKLRRED